MAKKDDKNIFNLDSILFNCRDILRSARNSGSFFEKRDMMLTLIFLRFIGEKYEIAYEKECESLKKEGFDLNDSGVKEMLNNLTMFSDGTYNLPEEARWSTIINTPANKLNETLDNALQTLSNKLRI